MKRKNKLEIGCGQGFNSYIESRKRNSHVIGIDLSKEDIEIAKKRYPNVKFMVMNAEKLAFKNNSFDTILAYEILEHVDNLDKVISECVRVLKMNGKFIVSIPHYNSEKWLLKVRPTYFKEIHHVRIFKKNELEKRCRKFNLKLTKKKKRGFLQHVELFFLFKRKINSKTQVSIGSWRDTFFTKLVHAGMLYFDPLILKTPLAYIPIWIATIPLGIFLNFAGNLFFPKGYYYEFKKI